MLVKNWMTQPVITIDKSEPIGLANQLMSSHKIRTLPVVSQGKLVGIVTDRDLKRVSVSESTGLEAPKVAYLNTRIKVGTIMTKKLITVTPYTTVDEVAKILNDEKISGVPVVDESGSLVGMITQGDIFKLFMSLTSIVSTGIKIAVEITTEPGSIKEVTDLIRELGGRIRNILTSYRNAPEGYRHTYIKFYDLPSDKLDPLIQQLEAKVKILYVIEQFEDNTPPRIVLMNC